jgi:diguanylate cyclase (GGDEF)-like protein/PAS domain S-box-containing protein
MDARATKCVLIVDSNQDGSEFVAGAVAGSNEKVHIETTAEASSALEQIRQGSAQMVILDISGARKQDKATLEQIISAAPHLPILILTDAENEVLARQLAQTSTHDYVLKEDLQQFRLRRIVRGMIETSEKREEAFLQQQCANAALACTSEAVLFADPGGRVQRMNGAAEHLTGWSQAEAAGRPLHEVLPVMDSQNAMAMEEVQHLKNGGRAEGLPTSVLLTRRDKKEMTIQTRSMSIRDYSGNYTGTVVVFHDVGAARAKTLELSHLAQHDFLTDLPNRVLLNDRIKQAIASAARYHKQLAVMFVDLDQFKKINDTYGHATGDKLLQSVAGRIVGCVRRSDTVSRQGGDEFIVLLSEVSHAEDSVFIARKILGALSTPYSIDQKHLCMSGSIGVSTFPDDGQDAETLIHKADTALYDAKKLGRNNYQFFRADMQARVLEWQSLEGSLRNAVGRNEFLLHYQPKVDLKTAEISGVEALLRWKHPERGLIQPLQFVPIAEESGLIVPIGKWVLLEACRQARAWIDAGLPPVRMAVNVSAVQFMDEDFLENVRDALRVTKIDASNLELELTETVLMQDADSAMETLHALKAIGVQLAVDDFGTGYSSFSYLRKFPLDALKVDRTFINEISAGTDNAAILSALISIGKSLKHRVVAEGIETLEQLDFLRRQGCSEGQGYYFSHPVPAARFAEFLESGVRETLVH